MKTSLKTAESPIILDLGCGDRKKTGAIGVDRIQLNGVDIVHDLDKFPYPFDDNFADCVILSHILEHVENPLQVMEEVWRITKPRARINIRVPHYSSILAWRDITHRRCFTSSSFDYFGENKYSYYTSARFKIINKRLQYFVDEPERLVLRWWGAIIQNLINRHPTFTERFLCYLIGGMDELQITLETLKLDTVKWLNKHYS